MKKIIEQKQVWTQPNLLEIDATQIASGIAGADDGLAGLDS